MIEFVVDVKFEARSLTVELEERPGESCFKGREIETEFDERVFAIEFMER